MWESIVVTVGAERFRGRYRTEGRQLVLEWRGGRAVEWCGILKPEAVAAACLRRLATRQVLAA
jgi:hypothetical protein